MPPPHGRLQKSLSFAFQTPTMMNEMYHQSCQSQLNSINYPERSYSRWWTKSMRFFCLRPQELLFECSFCLFAFTRRCDMYNHQHQHAHATTAHTNNGMNSRSRSVPEGLAHPNGDIHWNNNRTIGPNFYRTQSRQPIQVLEQITTSVWPKINLQNLLLCTCVYVLEGIVAFAS